MKKVAIQLTSMHKIPKLSPGGPGYMIQMIHEGFKFNESTWDTPYIGLDEHPIDKRGLASQFKHYIKQYSPKTLRSFFAFLRVRSWVNQYINILKKNKKILDKAHIIHIHDPIAYCAYKSISRKDNPKPVIFTDHSPGSFTQLILRYVPQKPYNKSEQYLRSLEIDSFKDADIITLISNGQHVLKTTEIPELIQYESKIKVIHNGIPDILEPNTAYKQAKNNRNEITLGFIGSLTKDKGVDILLDAYQVLLSKSANQNIKLIIAGDGPLRSDVEQATNDLLGKIDFLGFQKNIPEILNNIDIFISPGRRSGFDLAILEAMRASKAIIVSDTGGNREAVQDSGIILNEANPIWLAQEINKLIENTEFRYEIASRARKRFESEFRYDVMAKNYENIYNQLAYIE